MINRKKAIIVFVMIYLAIIVWRSAANTTIWQWIASISFSVLVVHMAYGANQIRKRFEKEALSDMLDLLILLSLLMAILVMPLVAVSNGFIAFFYYFIGLRYNKIKLGSPGRKYAQKKLSMELPLMVPFACIAIGSVIFPQIFSEMLQSIMLFFVMVIGSAWMLFFSGVYNMPQKNIK